jgi:hypothetical protein
LYALFLSHCVASPSTNWGMPKKNSNFDTTLKHTNTLKIHGFIQNNNKNTHAAHTGKTHKNKCINNNTSHNLTHN